MNLVDQIIGPNLGVFSSVDGKSWERIANPRKPLEEVRFDVAMQHNKMPWGYFLIVDMNTNETLHKFEPAQANAEQEELIRNAIIAEREQWLNQMMKWLLPEEVFSSAFIEGKQEVVATWLSENGIKLSFNPNGVEAAIWKSVDGEDELLASWPPPKKDLEELKAPGDEKEPSDTNEG